MLAGVGVVVGDFACGNIADDSVERRSVVFAFLADFEFPGWSSVLRSASGNWGDSNELCAFVEVGFLIWDADADGRRSFDAVAIPVAFVIEWVGGAL